MKMQAATERAAPVIVVSVKSAGIFLKKSIILRPLILPARRWRHARWQPPRISIGCFAGPLARRRKRSRARPKTAARQPCRCAHCTTLPVHVRPRQPSFFRDTWNASALMPLDNYRKMSGTGRRDETCVKMGGWLPRRVCLEESTLLRETLPVPGAPPTTTSTPCEQLETCKGPHKYI